MRKLVLLVLIVLATAFAVSAATASGPVDRQEGFPCGVIDGEGNVVLTFDSLLIVYASGKITLHCEAEDVSNPSGEVVIWTFDNYPVACGLNEYGSTTDFRNKVSKIGRAQLDCEGRVQENGDALRTSSAGGAGIG